MAEQNQDLQLTAEELVVDLQKKLAEALSKSDDQGAELELVNEKIESQAATLKSLEQENSVLSANNQALAKRNQELEAEITEATEKISVYENPSFEFEGSRYEILVKATVIPGHGTVTAADIQDSGEIQERLVRRNSGIIRKKF